MKMKTLHRFLIAIALTTLTTPAGHAGMSDLDIHCTPKESDAGGRQTSVRGTVNKAKEHWLYEISMENRSFKDMSGLQVKYIIFVKREKLGTSDPAALTRQKGEMPVDLRSHEKKLVSTNPVEINKSQLAADWEYADGARRKADDTLAGCWVRVYQNGQQIGEYANPSTLMKEKWE